eukprot:12397779-Karenia_brevis.AAC.1
MDCKWRNEEATLLEYLRTSTQNGDERKSQRRVLVATIMYSRLSDEYYQQWLALNEPFRSTEELWHDRAALVPEAYQ